jgi:hypothetical protein
MNNRAENSHRPVRKRERAMQRFKSPEHAERFLEGFRAVCNHFRPRRHRLLVARHQSLLEAPGTKQACGAIRLSANSRRQSEFLQALSDDVASPARRQTEALRGQDRSAVILALSNRDFRECVQAQRHGVRVPNAARERQTFFI